MGIENQTLEHQLALFPQFKSSEVIKVPNIPNDNGGLISELLSESNFEETNANQLNVRDNLKNMLLQM